MKVLDFGLAKIAEPAPAADPAQLSHPHARSGYPHRSDHGHGRLHGSGAGTGKKVDKRADIWAFGVVLYEMVTGRRLFTGEDMVEILAAVVHGQPDLSVVPPRVRKLIAKCLEKDPKKRLHDLSSVALLHEGGDATEPLTSVAQTISAVAPPPPTGALPRWAWAVMGALAFATLISAVTAMRSSSPPAASPGLKASLTMDLAPAEMLGPAEFNNRPSRTAFAISPDGATIVFSGIVTKGPDRTWMLHRRPLSEPQAVAIPGTEDAEYPFFSPDGQWVGFAARDKLRKVALSGGPPIDLCDFTFAGRIDGASWGSAGVIAFARRGLWTVSDSGGKPEAPFEGDTNTRLLTPIMLPDGHTVLFTERPSVKWEESHVDAIDLTTKQRKTLILNAADARYSPTGHLVFVRDEALLAVPFDAARAEVTGASVPLLAGIMQSTNAPNTGTETGMGQFALSASGTLVYAFGGRYPTRASTLVRVDRKGIETKLAEIKGSQYGLRLSSDGSRVVANKTNDGSRASDIWIYEVPSGASTRLTSTGSAYWPLFSPNGKSIVFSEEGNNPGIYFLPLNGNNAPQPVFEAKPGLFAASWSSDGKWLAYLQTVGNVRQIFIHPVQDSKLGSGEPRQFSPSTFEQRDAQFSPDGGWIAYSSNESGTFEVYVQPFPGPGEKHRISSKGGYNPAWSRNSREVFYYVYKPVTVAGAVRYSISMTVVDLSTTGGFKASDPHPLFEGPYSNSLPLRSYDVTPDGQFIMMRTTEPPDERVTKLNVVLGWAGELKRRVPTR